MTLVNHLFAAHPPGWARGVVGVECAECSAARAADRCRPRTPARTSTSWTIAMEWGLTLALLAWWQWAARPLPALGVVLPEGTGAWWTVLVCVAGIFFYVQQARTVAASPDAQASLRKELESQPNVRMILPRTVREARAFTGVAITAGVCEEVLYRGYLLRDLQSLGLGRGAVVVAIVAFGLAHAFQGIRGSVASGVTGAVFMGLYLLTGSLVAPIVLHATGDFANFLMAYRFFQRTRHGSVIKPGLARQPLIVPTFPGAKNSASDIVPACMRTKASSARRLQRLIQVHPCQLP